MSPSVHRSRLWLRAGRPIHALRLGVAVAVLRHDHGGERPVRVAAVIVTVLAGLQNSPHVKKAKFRKSRITYTGQLHVEKMQDSGNAQYLRKLKHRSGSGCK